MQIAQLHLFDYPWANKDCCCDAQMFIYNVNFEQVSPFRMEDKLLYIVGLVIPAGCPQSHIDKILRNMTQLIYKLTDLPLSHIYSDFCLISR